MSLVCRLSRLLVYVMVVIQSGTSLAEAEELQVPQPVSLVNLIATPERFSGRLVVVSGYVSVELENMSLCFNQKPLSTKDCLWLGIAAGPYDTEKDYKRYVSRERALKRFHGLPASVIGTFDEAETGHFGMWSGGITSILSVRSRNTQVDFSAIK